MASKEQGGMWKKWKLEKAFKVVGAVAAFVTIIVSAKALSSCAGANPETKATASSASATANPSATASPNQSQTQNLIVVPPAAPAPAEAPAAKAGTPHQQSDHGAMTFNGENKGIIIGPGAHDNKISVDSQRHLDDEIRRAIASANIPRGSSIDLLIFTGYNASGLLEEVTAYLSSLGYEVGSHSTVAGVPVKGVHVDSPSIATPGKWAISIGPPAH